MLTLTKALELLSIPYLDRELLQKLYSLTTELLVNGSKMTRNLNFYAWSDQSLRTSVDEIY